MVEDLSPPLSLLKYPPLAFFLNNCLVSLNYLREFPLLSIAEKIYQLFDHYFQKVVQYIIDQSIMIREKGNKYFGEGYMSNLGSTMSSLSTPSGGKTSTPASTTTSTTTTTTKKSKGEKLDCLYAEAIATDLLPYLYMCFLFSYQRISFPLIKAYLTKNQLLPSQQMVTNNGNNNNTNHVTMSKHWMTDLRQSKELFGLLITNRLEEYWKLFLQAKLLEEHQIQLHRSIIPLNIPPPVTTVAVNNGPPNTSEGSRPSQEEGERESVALLQAKSEESHPPSDVNNEGIVLADSSVEKEGKE